MKFSLLLILMMLFSISYGQYTQEDEEEVATDVVAGKPLSTIVYSKQMVFKEGAYRTFKEFRSNAPSITLKKNTTAKPDSLIAAMKKDTNVLLYAADDHLPDKLARKKVWGYCQDNTIYVLVYDEFLTSLFFKIDIIGEIMLASRQTITNGTGVSAGLSSGGTAITAGGDQMHTKLQLIDGQTGVCKKYNVTHFTEILQRDEVIYEEYNNLTRKKRKDMLFVYLSKFNRKHPFYFDNE